MNVLPSFVARSIQKMCKRPNIVFFKNVVILSRIEVINGKKCSLINV